MDAAQLKKGAPMGKGKIIAGPALRAEAIRATGDLLHNVRRKQMNLAREAGHGSSYQTQREWIADTESRLAALRNLDEFMNTGGR